MITGVLILGLMMIAVALKGTGHELAAQLQHDLLGADGFIAWIAAIAAIGALGYVPGLRTASRYMLALLAVVILIRNGGVFANAQAELMKASGQGPAPSIPTQALSSSSSSSGGSGGGSGGGDTLSTVATVAEVAALL